MTKIVPLEIVDDVLMLLSVILSPAHSPKPPRTVHAAIKLALSNDRVETIPVAFDELKLIVIDKEIWKNATKKHGKMSNGSDLAEFSDDFTTVEFDNDTLVKSVKGLHRRQSLKGRCGRLCKFPVPTKLALARWLARWLTGSLRRPKSTQTVM